MRPKGRSILRCGEGRTCGVPDVDEAPPPSWLDGRCPQVFDVLSDRIFGRFIRRILLRNVADTKVHRLQKSTGSHFLLYIYIYIYIYIPFRCSMAT